MTDRITWRLPWRWQVRREVQELRPLFAPASLARIAGISVAIIFVMWLCVERWFGPVEFNWIGSTAASVVGGIIAMAIASFGEFIPKTIDVTPEAITIGMQGIPYSGAIEASVKRGEPAVLILTVDKTTTELPVGSDVDLDALERMVAEGISKKPAE